MTRWTEKYVQQLQKNKKIRGYSIPDRQKNYSSNGNQVTIPREEPKGIIWLRWNLWYWCNQRAVLLEEQYKFDEQRNFKSDFAIHGPTYKFIIEYEGGIFMARGGHNSPTGIQRDIDKYQLADKLGYTVIRCTALTYTTVPKTLNDLIK